MQAVGDLAEAIANSRGGTLVGRGLRLVEEMPPEPIDYELDGGMATPVALGRLYELLLTSERRRTSGVHLTPAKIARRLVRCLPEVWVRGGRPARVLDPAVGGGAFLLAAADCMLAAGAAPGEVIGQLRGYDIDEGAVAVAEAAVGLWGLEHHVAPRPLNALQLGDGLLAELPETDVVVGNPPFLNQLRKSSKTRTQRRGELRERWGDLVGAYTDDAWLFLAAGIDALAAGGGLAMIQPVSILAAQHAGAVRARVQNAANLSGLWISDGHVFDAAVQVCGVVATMPNSGADSSQESGAPTAGPAVRRWTGAEFEAKRPTTGPPDPTSWGPIGAGGRGIPDVQLHTSAVVADFASATAGFRDQFYGFAPHVMDQAADDRSEARRLVTVGMIDPLCLRWGNDDFRFSKKLYRRPTVQVPELCSDDPVLAEWVKARRRPKILVATQTRVVEAWVDESGETVPATPVISVEPHSADHLWLLAAALLAPPVTAHFVAQRFGTALSLDALKLAARDVAQTPLPVDRKSWERGAQLARAINDSPGDGSGPERARLLRSFGEVMADAYEIDRVIVVDWWLARLPKRY